MITLNSENLKSIDWVERSILLDETNNKLYVEFIIVGDLDFDLTFISKFETEQEAIYCAEKFISQKLDVSDAKGTSKFEITKESIHLKNLKARKQLLEQLFEGKIQLPDDGYKFILDAIDIESLHLWYEDLVNEYEFLIKN